MRIINDSTFEGKKGRGEEKGSEKGSLPPVLEGLGGAPFLAHMKDNKMEERRV